MCYGSKHLIKCLFYQEHYQLTIEKAEWNLEKRKIFVSETYWGRIDDICKVMLYLKSFQIKRYRNTSDFSKPISVYFKSIVRRCGLLLELNILIIVSAFKKFHKTVPCKERPVSSQLSLLWEFECVSLIWIDVIRPKLFFQATCGLLTTSSRFSFRPVYFAVIFCSSLCCAIFPLRLSTSSL